VQFAVQPPIACRAKSDQAERHPAPQPRSHLPPVSIVLASPVRLSSMPCPIRHLTAKSFDTVSDTSYPFPMSLFHIGRSRPHRRPSSGSDFQQLNTGFRGLKVPLQLIPYDTQSVPGASEVLGVATCVSRNESSFSLFCDVKPESGSFWSRRYGRQCWTHQPD
jgi:hypothetical protein